MLVERRKLLVGSAVAACFASLAKAQFIPPGFPPGAFQSRSALDASAAAGVTVDATGTKSFVTPATTSANYTGITVGSGAHRALIITLNFDGSSLASAISATWDSGGTNQAMTQLAFTDAGGTQFPAALFGLVAPTSGNKTLALSWTGSSRVFVDAISFTGVNQTGGTTSFPGATTGQAVNTITVSSASGDIVVSCGNGTVTGITGTTIFSDNTSGTNVNAFANYNPGAGSVVTGSGGLNSVLVGVDVKAG